MQFLIKYKPRIVLALMLLVLLFGFIPGQKHWYLTTDYEAVEQRSKTLSLWALGIVAAILLILVVKHTRNMKEIASAVTGIVAIAVALYFLLPTLLLSLFLAFNRIDVAGKIERKYTVTFFREPTKDKPLLYDFNSGHILYLDSIPGLENRHELHLNDTVTVSFKQGLLGIPFSPALK